MTTYGFYELEKGTYSKTNIYYIEAESQEEAQNIFESGKCDVGDFYDEELIAENHEIFDIQKII